MFLKFINYISISESPPNETRVVFVFIMCIKSINEFLVNPIRELNCDLTNNFIVFLFVTKKVLK